MKKMISLVVLAGFIISFSSSVAEQQKLNQQSASIASQKEQESKLKVASNDEWKQYNKELSMASK